MASYTEIIPGSYKINQIQQTTNTFLSECNDIDCIFRRSKHTIRDKYEKKIEKNASNKKEIAILFYGSFLLEQEQRIINRIKNSSIREIHLVDNAYDNELDDKSNIDSAIKLFAYNIKQKDICGDIYIHSKSSNLKNLVLDERIERIDLACGIDISYICKNNDQDLRDVCKYVLKNGGLLVISCNYFDLIDISIYENKDNLLKLIKSTDYVKDEYYRRYKAESYLNKILKGSYIILCFVSGMIFRKKPLALIFIVGTGILFYHRIFSTDYVRKIKSIREICI